MKRCEVLTGVVVAHLNSDELRVTERRSNKDDVVVDVRKSVGKRSAAQVFCSETHPFFWNSIFVVIEKKEEKLAIAVTTEIAMLVDWRYTLNCALNDVFDATSGPVLTIVICDIHVAKKENAGKGLGHSDD